MPTIGPDLEGFVAAKRANGAICSPLPAAGPPQRGPSCGFYAVGHVMQYWHARLANTAQAVPAPLPARTSMAGPKPAQYDHDARTDRDRKAAQGEFTSLRQVGKFLRVTVHGSVFNAANLLQVARMQGVQGQQGMYDGHVITTATPGDYVSRVQALVSHDCPVIVPFDVDDEGDPFLSTGKRAHWGTIFGWYKEAGDVFFIHYHWGAYRYSRAADFAASTQSLVANAFLIMQKMEQYDPMTGRIEDRGHFGVRYVKQYEAMGWRMRPLAAPRANVEFTNPRTLDLPFLLQESNDLVREHGFDPTNVANAGLKDKLVAIYPASLRGTLAAL